MFPYVFFGGDEKADTATFMTSDVGDVCTCCQKCMHTKIAKAIAAQNIQLSPSTASSIPRSVDFNLAHDPKHFKTGHEFQQFQQHEQPQQTPSWDGAAYQYAQRQHEQPQQTPSFEQLQMQQTPFVDGVVYQYAQRQHYHQPGTLKLPEHTYNAGPAGVYTLPTYRSHHQLYPIQEPSATERVLQEKPPETPETTVSPRSSPRSTYGFMV